MQETRFQRAARLNKQNDECNAGILKRVEELAVDRPSEMHKMVYGYAINRGGPNGIDTRAPIFGFCPVHDDGGLNMRNRCKVLTRVVGGFLWLNYCLPDVCIDREGTKWIKDFYERHGILF